MLLGNSATMGGAIFAQGLADTIIDLSGGHLQNNSALVGGAAVVHDGLLRSGQSASDQLLRTCLHNTASHGGGGCVFRSFSNARVPERGLDALRRNESQAGRSFITAYSPFRSQDDTSNATYIKPSAIATNSCPRNKESLEIASSLKLATSPEPFFCPQSASVNSVASRAWCAGLAWQFLRRRDIVAERISRVQSEQAASIGHLATSETHNIAAYGPDVATAAAYADLLPAAGPSSAAIGPPISLEWFEYSVREPVIQPGDSVTLLAVARDAFGQAISSTVRSALSSLETCLAQPSNDTTLPSVVAAARVTFDCTGATIVTTTVGGAPGASVSLTTCGLTVPRVLAAPESSSTTQLDVRAASTLRVQLALCAQGEYIEAADTEFGGVPTCVQCPIGFIAAADRAENGSTADLGTPLTCAPCPLGSVSVGAATTDALVRSAEPGGVRCAVCARGLVKATSTSIVQFSGAEAQTVSISICAECPPKFFSRETGAKQCEPCPVGAVCVGGAPPVVLTGWWRSSPQSHSIYSCHNPDACLGVEDAQAVSVDSVLAYFDSIHSRCRALSSTNATIAATIKEGCTMGYRGLKCMQCTEDYAWSAEFVCSKCPSNFLIVAGVLGLVLLTAVIVILLYRLTIKQGDKLADPELAKTVQDDTIGVVVKLLVSHLQVRAV